MQLPITIGLHRSRIVDGVLLLVGSLAAVVWCIWPHAIGIQLTGVALILSGLWFIRWQLEPSLRILRMDREGGMSGSTGAGDGQETLYALSGAIVHPWLTVVRFRGESGRRYTVLATVDSMSPEDFRRFRVFLRWRVKFDEPAGDV